MSQLTYDGLSNPMSYERYFKFVEGLVSENKTSGRNQSESLSNYTKLNLQRMKRWNKHGKPSTEVASALEQIPFGMKWVILTEAWCGDAAQNIPFIANLAALSTNVELTLVLRDENLYLMNQHLTNGGMSIPKLIMYHKESGEELASWGPRPLEVQNLVVEYKANLADTIPYAEFSEQIHLWYAKNRNENLQRELLSLLQSIQPL